MPSPRYARFPRPAARLIRLVPLMVKQVEIADRGRFDTAVRLTVTGALSRFTSFYDSSERVSGITSRP
jgi:hypothetical protein